MTRLIIDKGVRVPMRDGVELVADIYRPDVAEPVPTLIQRTPYDRQVTAFTILPVDVLRMAESGYAIVVQDTRGRGGSQGVFTPFSDEADDGADTVDWAADQAWSSGRVGMFGQSYVGAPQWLAATRAPGALRAIAPVITPADYHEGWIYQGGAFGLGFSLLWTLMFLGPAELVRKGAPAEAVGRMIAAADKVEELYARMPLSGLPELGDAVPFYDEWLAHPADGPFWERIAPSRGYERITAPALNIGGWYDLGLTGTLANYRGMRDRGGSDVARTRQRLIVGPWAHGVPGGSFVERSYGLGAGIEAIDVTGQHRAWFDGWLKGDGSGPPPGKPVLLFVMGANTWREEEDWPLPDTQYVDWFLHSRGSADSGVEDGTLSPERPGDEPADTFTYDPRDPTPTVGGATFLPGVWLGVNAGPRDQRAIESRADVLCYTSPPLDRPLEVIGPVQLILYASSSARDTDFVGKLIDVAPDGRAEILCDGILRARYRRSPSEPVLLEPGEIEEYEIDLGATAYVFDEGHRIRLDVTSSNFPRFDRNTNTGGAIANERLEDAVIATNSIHHTKAHPSRLVLPVIDRR